MYSRALSRLARQAAGTRTATPRLTRSAIANPRPWVSSLSRTQVRTFIKSTSDSDVNAIPNPSSVGVEAFPAIDTFPRRHIGPDAPETAKMLKALSPPAASLDEFVASVIPKDILSARNLSYKPDSKTGASALPESEVLELGEKLSGMNSYKKSFIGAGYHGTITPGVIKRNVLENPAWYTSYTPYQPEISQGRLEALLNFQTLVSDLTALPIANASLLDEGTAASEAMTLSMNVLPTSRAKREGKTFLVSHMMHPQTIAVLSSRAEGFGIAVEKIDVSAPEAHDRIKGLGQDLVGVMVQYPDTEGNVKEFKALADAVHEQKALLSAATDLLSLTMLTPPGEWGADIAFGTAQRFGVPMGFGGPHAAFFAAADKYKRRIPGRIIGVSKDRLGGKALRLALQTREQHIRREKATSNVCTAQALLANMASLYAVYHGPQGLKAIAERTILGARVVQSAAESYGLQTKGGKVNWDTIVVRCPAGAKNMMETAEGLGMNLRYICEHEVGVTVDETTSFGDLVCLAKLFRTAGLKGNDAEGCDEELTRTLLKKEAGSFSIPETFKRTSSYLQHPVFNTHHSETEMLRYIHLLESKDVSLVHSMIPLGSCTMKLNGTTEMQLISLPWSNVHPYVPENQAKGTMEMIRQLEEYLMDITAMEGVSLQPNSGAQGEFAGLRAIRKFHVSKGDRDRDICLIPVSAHGTNPASAAMAGMRVVPIKCDGKTGNLDIEDLEAKCQKHQRELAAIMITYPSTYGVFEPAAKEVCGIVHRYGGQVYMDGANMNAQIGLCSPGEIGADVCHLNLHKTFCIPHGGGGPGVGPICVKKHLKPYLPSQDVKAADPGENHPVSSARFGSASILPISWAYTVLMGGSGLTHATKITLLSANYLLGRLKEHFEILYTNSSGRCAHEFILDVRPFVKSAGIEAIDIAKRLQDYGFHAPTMSFPIPGTLMIEPTESESLEELERFVDALVSIRGEICEIEEGKTSREMNVLKMAPHPASDLTVDWAGRGYSREKAVYPKEWVKERKVWPATGRVDDAYGDMHLFCTCPPVEDTTGNNNN
ncbi:hypothetical protein MKZ38_004964 [Zalerion maritima]|uniref:Glycine cleavage system P protein n=1 Tax=Zalerion maritima TaxID=339359 RepID=A0AAD5WPK8_9PEZI|nr:hypothetical protein MKZ38_004964 [Zalerion maritima]